MTEFESARERLAKSIAKAGFHPHPPAPPASRHSRDKVLALIGEGLVPARYRHLARAWALDADEATQLIEAGERQRRYRKRGRRVAFRPCETSAAAKKRIQEAVAGACRAASVPQVS